MAGRRGSCVKTGLGLPFQHVVRNSRDFYATAVTFADARRANLVSWRARCGLSSGGSYHVTARGNERRSIFGEAIARAYRDCDYRLREIAAALGCHYATISRRLRAFEKDGMS